MSEYKEPEIIQDLENALEAITYCSYCDAMSSINSALESIKRTSEWVSVAERLPEELVCVDVSIRQGDYEGRVPDCFYEKGRWWTWTNVVSGDKIYIDFVTHWMPLPTPPKGDE